MSRHLRGSTFAVVAALLAFTVVAGCSSGGGGDSTSDGTAGSGQAPVEQGQSDQAAAASDSLAPGKGSAAVSEDNAVVLEPRALIKTGAVRLHSNDVRQVLDDITGVVTAHGGEIASEATTTDDDGQQQRSRLELRIPVVEFEATLLEVADLGSFVAKSQQTEDVTAQVVDVNTRVESAEQTIESLRRLFVRATKLGQIITLESQLAQRQADLEALLAQQKLLSDQTAMSTISVEVTRTPDAEKPPADGGQAGFVTGIKQGWDAFTTFVVGAGHALGVTLPLGSLFVAIALVAWVVVRRRLPHSEPQPTD